MMNGKVILAGAGSLFGHEKILDSFRSLGLDPVLIEVPYVKKYMSQQNHGQTLGRDGGDCKIVFTENLDLPSAQKAMVIPLSEYWISRCAELDSTAGTESRTWCPISDTAFKASRSKKFLYGHLKKAGFAVPEIFDSADQARNFIRSKKGNRVVVKPEGLFSGYGVKIVGHDNLEKLDLYAYNACNVRNNAIKLFRISSSSAMITQALEGTEYSADIFFHHGRISIVRVCRKVIAEIHDSPCTAICQLVECSDAMVRAIEGWAHAIFGEEDVTFGQFDFIDASNASNAPEVTAAPGTQAEPDSGTGNRTETAAQTIPQSKSEDFVPIDFACRIGGGMAELLSEYENETGINVYARAISQMNLPQDSTNSAWKKNPDGLYWTQHNYLSTKSGTLKDDLEKLTGGLIPGKAFIYKGRNDFVPECPSSAASRIAVIVNRSPLLYGRDALLAAEKLLVREDAVEFWKNSRGKRPAD